MKTVFKIFLGLVALVILWATLSTVRTWPYVRAKVRFAQRDFPGALADTERVVSKFPDNADFIVGLAQAKIGVKDYEGALTATNTALEKISKGARVSSETVAIAYLVRCQATKELQYYPDVIENCTKLMELVANPQKISFLPYMSRGLAFYNLGNYEKALADYNQAIELEPDLAKLYNLRAIAKLALGKYEDAQQDFNRAIELQPDELGYLGQGFLKEEQKNYKEAIEDYTNALKASAEMDSLTKSFVYNRRGWSKNLVKDYMGAVKDHNRAIELNPNNADAYFGIASVCMKEKKYKAAVNYISRAIEIDPSSAKYSLSRGFSKSQLKDYKGAITDYTRAIELDAAYPAGQAQAYQYRAKAKKALGDIAGATADEKKANQLATQR